MCLGLHNSFVNGRNFAGCFFYLEETSRQLLTLHRATAGFGRILQCVTNGPRKRLGDSSWYEAAGIILLNEVRQADNVCSDDRDAAKERFHCAAAVFGMRRHNSQIEVRVDRGNVSSCSQKSQPATTMFRAEFAQTVFVAGSVSPSPTNYHCLNIWISFPNQK